MLQSTVVHEGWRFLLYVLGVNALVELAAAVGLDIHLSDRVAGSVQNLEEEHAVVVEDVEEKDAVDEEREGVLYRGAVVALVDVLCVDLGADENELHEH